MAEQDKQQSTPGRVVVTGLSPYACWYLSRIHYGVEFREKASKPADGGYKLKKSVSFESSEKATIRAASPARAKSLAKSGSEISRLSPKQNTHSGPSGTRKYQALSPVAVSATIRLSEKCRRKPRNMPRVPSPETRNACIGMDSVISLSASPDASSDEIMFLLIAKEKGLEDAIFWANTLGLEYSRPLEIIRQSL
jgi:hypothetical protein